MQTETFKATINAPREKVWQTLWDDATYRAWTAAFAAGSWAKTDWKKGSKVLFLNQDEEGMVSRIEDNIPNEYMSIKHLGMVNKGVESFDENDGWSGALENYTLKAVNGQTELTVELSTKNGIPEEHKEYFIKTWPIALQKLKELAEQSN
ncbi:SRPBCC domain-containing protein [Chitinophaga agrisoli]|uniref:SRPBCC domain-containing protein n=1 Tax=Chitinophaga agrisoli TaxID=2607653 RepID=A0A5B2VK51_9BACT|nr:SRPBCC domain-containing protein [Chitinophaga agrisoli]KAA2239441.1 SRPBCC domain-containing protein [Chitinophaga agrisoli]